MPPGSNGLQHVHMGWFTLETMPHKIIYLATDPEFGMKLSMTACVVQAGSCAFNRCFKLLSETSA